MKKTKEQIIEILEGMAVFLQLQGANPFKVRAFENAARSLETFSEDLEPLLVEKKLQTIQGVGKGIAAAIEEISQTGTFQEFEDLKKEYPETLLELLKIPNVGPKKVKALYEKLGIKTIGELEYACNENRLTTLDGFGEKTQAKILEGIAFLKKTKGQYLLPEVLEQIEPIVEEMKKWKEIDQISIAGSLRRHKETVHDADVVCSSTSSDKIMAKFLKLPEAGTLIGSGETKTSIVLKSGLQVDLRVVTPKEFPFALHHFTGSKEHNTWIRGIAKDKGLKLNEYGLWKGKKSLPCKSEEEIFKALGIPYIPPELREAKIEIEIVEKKSNVPNLVNLSDIKGFFHLHTTYSDGSNSLEEMVAKAQNSGYEYVGISDHSQTAVYASGLKEEDIERQHQEIDRLQKKYSKIRIFKGIESDILRDGKLDYPDSILKKFDFVIASVHSQFNLTEKEMTDRCLCALRNKYTTMLGHPTGRLLLGREGFAVNITKLIDEAANLGKCMELNSHPHRLDLDWRLLPYAKNKKVMISINPDAHSTNGVDAIQFGVMMARKGGLEKKDIWNTMPLKLMEKKLEEVHKD